MRQTSVRRSLAVLVVVLLPLMAACAIVSTSSLEPSDTRSASSSAEPAADLSLVVPKPREVLGEWRVVSVGGDPPPEHALKGLWMSRGEGELWASWSDGVNDHGVTWTLTRSGDYKAVSEVQTAVGCRLVDHPSDPTSIIEQLLTGGPVPQTDEGDEVEDDAGAETWAGCERPSGFGASGAAGLRLTTDGDLVFLAADGSEAARYTRAD